tara:strand:- start:838 stop:1155 length:318 start_codon:yes stop_codon:yes gene_type:complete
MSEHKVLVTLKKRSSNGELSAGIVVSTHDPFLDLGSKTDNNSGFFSLIYVTDLQPELEAELLGREKKLRVPDIEDPMYTSLISNNEKSGRITVNTETLLNYVEIV